MNTERKMIDEMQKEVSRLSVVVEDMAEVVRLLSEQSAKITKNQELMAKILEKRK